MKNTAGILILLLSVSLSSFSDPGMKPGRVKKDQRKECKKQSGACMIRIQKDYKTPFKYKKIQIRSNRKGR